MCVCSVFCTGCIDDRMGLIWANYTRIWGIIMIGGGWVMILCVWISYFVLASLIMSWVRHMSILRESGIIK